MSTKICTATCLSEFDGTELLAENDVAGNYVVAFAGNRIDSSKLTAFSNVADFFRDDPEERLPLVVADEAARLALFGLALRTVVEQTDPSAEHYMFDGPAGDEDQAESWTLLENAIPAPDYHFNEVADSAARLALTGLTNDAVVKQTDNGHLFVLTDDTQPDQEASWNEFQETP